MSGSGFPLPLARTRARSVGAAPLDVDGGGLGLRPARFCQELARLLPGAGPVDWEQAGSWRLLYGWQLTAASVAAVSDAAQRLLEAGGPGHWETLLAWLDNGRSTTATSEQLFIHRATLHYRLSRAREVLGEPVLDDGWRTTALHVALRLHAALQQTSAD